MLIGEFLSLAIFDGYAVRGHLDLESISSGKVEPLPVDEYRHIKNPIEDFDRIIINPKQKEITILVHYH